MGQMQGMVNGWCPAADGRAHGACRRPLLAHSKRAGAVAIACPPALAGTKPLCARPHLPGHQPCTRVPRLYRRYQDYQKDDIPVVPLDAEGASSVRVMAGVHAGTTGPIKMRNPGLLMDVRLAPKGTFKQEVRPGPGRHAVGSVL
jgi:hypothetical protein